MTKEYIDIEIENSFQEERITNSAKLIYTKGFTNGIRFAIKNQLNKERQMPTKQMNFGEALENLKVGNKIARTGWNGKGMWLGLQKPDAHSKMGLPYIYMSTVDGKLVPWLASQTDVLAEDWEAIGTY